MRPRMLPLEKIGQFKRNPHLKTTTGARLDPKHIDERLGIVEETASKDSQTIRRWHISRGVSLRVGPDTGNDLGMVGCGKRGASVKTAVILLKLLPLMIWLVICIRGEERFYTLERQGVVVLGRLPSRQFLHPDAARPRIGTTRRRSVVVSR